ncbi:MAG: hypothetical protein PW843_21430 [Azospirillaceae bacterium]|nr:hypothetical protein [Azospirillaceae bacterium]
MSRITKLSHISVVNGRFIFRKRIPDYLRPLTAEMFGVCREFTVSLGSNPKQAQLAYPVVMFTVLAKLQRVQIEHERQSNASSPLEAETVIPQWLPPNLASGFLALEKWHTQSVLAALPEPAAEKNTPQPLRSSKPRPSSKAQSRCAHTINQTDHDGVSELTPFSGLTTYYLTKRKTKSEDVETVKRRFLESLGEDMPIGTITKKDVVRFRNLLEKIPARVTGNDRHLSLPELAKKYDKLT